MPVNGSIMEVYHLQTQGSSSQAVVEKTTTIPTGTYTNEFTIIVLHIPPWLVLMDSK